MPSKVLWSSGEGQWSTPPELFAELDAEFHFALDAAADASNTKVAGNWYGPDHVDPARRDGLSRDWAADAGGAVWLNPPYGPGIGRWVERADQAGVVVVCLVPARVDTAWFHNHCVLHEVRLLRGRLRFNGHRKAAPFPSCVVVMRDGSTVTCRWCEDRFVAQRSDAVYCSGRCRMAAHRAGR
jgi:phage N-6-adenine-methyltransferase